MPPPPVAGLAMTAFLVERYAPSAVLPDLEASVARVARRCAEAGDQGPSVEYLQSAYLRSEDTIFCLFSGPSAEAVRTVNNDADFALDRITEAVLLHTRTPPEDSP